MFGPDAALVTGTKDDPEDGSLRVYVQQGDTGLHTHVPAAHRAEFLQQMGGFHNVIPHLPEAALCWCPEPQEATQ
jgi:hypothetical protein